MLCASCFERNQVILWVWISAKYKTATKNSTLKDIPFLYLLHKKNLREHCKLQTGGFTVIAGNLLKTDIQGIKGIITECISRKLHSEERL